MLRLLPVVFVLLCASVVSATSPQNDPCNPSIALTMSDPAYKEATKVAERLRSHGISVRCVLSSKEAQMFEGELGAAFFQSDVGDFEALFLPGSKSWDALNVVEQRGTDGFTRYQFSGTPSYSGTWVGKPVYFFKHGNVFFHSLNSQTISRVRGVYEQLCDAPRCGRPPCAMTHIGIILRGQTQHLVIVNDNNGGNFRGACSGASIPRSGPDCP